MNEDILDHQILDDSIGPLFIKPSLIKRTKCTILDSMMIILLMYLVSILITALYIDSTYVRILSLVAILLYEPVLTSIGKTIGQKIMGLRVLEFSSRINSRSNRINIFKSLVRYIFKILLGWISLLTVHSDSYGRALHDKFSGSVMTND